jgi:organic hydroperoxide reductase OsmC/OhrA
VSVHAATVAWALDVAPAEFLARRYSRLHRIAFAEGVEVTGSAATSVVKPPYASAAAVDPEAAFTASLSACHMLWFLDHAVRAGLVVASYEDHAEGTLGRRPDGRFMMTRVALRPRVAFAGETQPSAEAVARLHAAAHHDCFIANSVTTEIVVEPPPAP